MKMETNNCPRRVQLRVGKNFTGVRHPSTFGLGHKYRRSVRPERLRTVTGSGRRDGCWPLQNDTQLSVSQLSVSWPEGFYFPDSRFESVTVLVPGRRFVVDFPEQDAFVASVCANDLLYVRLELIEVVRVDIPRLGRLCPAAVVVTGNWLGHLLLSSSTYISTYPQRVQA